MKKYFFFSLVFFAILCNTTVAQDFQLYDSNVKRWNAGQRMSGYSFDYNFRFKALKNLKNIEIKGIWIDTLFYEAKTFVEDTEHKSCFTIKKGERLLVKTNVRFVPNEFEEYKSNYIENQDMPNIKDKNFKALIYYIHKGKKRYHIIYDIETLPQINMP